MNFSDKENTGQLNGLSTGNSLREMMEEKSHYAIDMLFPFVAWTIDRSIRFEAS